MKLNTKVRYGLRAMIEIASQPESVLQKDISKNQCISIKYLDQIISSLKAAGLIIRFSGKNSGYRLAKKPEEISVYDVYNAFESKLNVKDCNSNDENCPKTKDCKLTNYWCSLNTVIISHMKSQTLDSMLKKSKTIK